MVVTRPHYDDNTFSRLGRVAQIARKWAESSPVAANLLPVNPNRRVIVDRLKVEQHTPPTPLTGHLHLSPVPDRLQKVVVLHPGKLRFRAERNRYLAG